MRDTTLAVRRSWCPSSVMGPGDQSPAPETTRPWSQSHRPRSDRSAPRGPARHAMMWIIRGQWGVTSVGTRRLSKAVAVVAVLAVVALGCGGGGSDDRAGSDDRGGSGA